MGGRNEGGSTSPSPHTPEGVNRDTSHPTLALWISEHPSVGVLRPPPPSFPPPWTGSTPFEHGDLDTKAESTLDPDTFLTSPRPVPRFGPHRPFLLGRTASSGDGHGSIQTLLLGADLVLRGKGGVQRRSEGACTRPSVHHGHISTTTPPCSYLLLVFVTRNRFSANVKPYPVTEGGLPRGKEGPARLGTVGVRSTHSCEIPHMTVLRGDLE